MSRDVRHAGVDRMVRSPPPPRCLQPRRRDRGYSPSQRRDRDQYYSPKSDRFALPRRTQERQYSPPRSHERDFLIPRTRESPYPPPRALERRYSPPRELERLYSPPRALEHLYSPPRTSKHYYSPPRQQERHRSPPRARGRHNSQPRARDLHYLSPRAREHNYSQHREREHHYSPPSRAHNQKHSPPGRISNCEYVSPMRSRNREFMTNGDVNETEGRRVEYFHDLEWSRKMERKDDGPDFGKHTGVGSTSVGGERWYVQPQNLNVSEHDSKIGDKYGGPSGSRRKYEFIDGLTHRDSTSVKYQFRNLDDPPKNDTLNNPIDHGFSGAKVSCELGNEGRPYPGFVDSRSISVEVDRRRLCSSYAPPSLDIGDPPRSSGFGDAGGYATGPHNLSMQLHNAAELNSFQGTQHLDKSATEGQVSRDVYMETDTLRSLRHSKFGPNYVASSSQLNALFTNGSSTAVRNGITNSFGEDGHVPSDGSGRLSGPIGYGHDSGIRSPKGKVDDIGIYSPYFTQTEERYMSCMNLGIHSTKAVISTRPSEFYRKNVAIGEECSHQDVSGACIMDPIKCDEFSHRENLTENKLWDYIPFSQGHSTQGYYGASGALEKGKQEMDILEYEGNNTKHEREAYNKVYRSPHELHHYEMVEHPHTFQEKSGVLYRDHNPHLDERNDSIHQGLVERIQIFPKSSTGMFKRKHETGRELIIPGGFGIITSSDGRTVRRIQERGDGTEMCLDGTKNSETISKKLKVNHSKHGKNIKKYNVSTHERLNRNHSTSIATRLSKASKHGTRDIKKRLGPHPQDVNTSHSSVKKYKSSLKHRLGPRPQKNRSKLPWLKNLTSYKASKDKDDSAEIQPDQVDDPLESSVTPLKNEPPEESEDFKQLVHNAFFKYVKHLNETPARRRKYTKQGTPSCLKCIICGRDSEEFEDVDSLAMHALTSSKAGVRSQHLGFHKALCVLMGWKSAEGPNTTWVREILPEDESLALKEDLIIWPPVVVIHNVTLTNNNTDERVVVSVEELEAKLRDMGFGGKVCRGKPANQSVLVAKFAATLSGLQEAERLGNIYAERKHGRAELQQISTVSSGIEDVLYGYLGIVEDLDKLDFETKKRSKLKSKKEIQNIAVSSSTTKRRRR